MYTEDIDFCAAIRARGRKVLFVPDVEVVHLRGRSRQTVPAATQAAYRRSHIAFYDKHHPAWAPWLRRYLRWRGQLPGRRRKSPTPLPLSQGEGLLIWEGPPSTPSRHAVPDLQWDVVRIAIDARKLHDFGIGTYVQNLLRHLARLDAESEYVLFCKADDRESLSGLGPNFRPSWSRLNPIR